MYTDKATWPTKPGMYWARSGENYKWFNVIAIVYDEPPYLRVDAVDLAGGKTISKDVSPSELIWGPEIDVPKLETTQD